MTDIRSLVEELEDAREVIRRYEDRVPLIIARADRAEIALAEMTERCGKAQEEWVDAHIERDAARSVSAEWERRADKAEAALAECQEWRDKWKLAVDEMTPALAKARFDAKALAEAGSHSVYCATPFALYASGDCTCGWSAALAAHEEATKA